MFSKRNRKITLALMLGVWALVHIILFGNIIYTHTLPSYDFSIIPAAIQAFNDGHNFYLVSELMPYSHQALSIPHLFVWLKITSLCATGGKLMYLFYFTLFFGIAYWLTPKKRSLDIECFLLIFCGFSGFFWVLHQGNNEVISFLLFAVAFRFLYFKKWLKGSLIMGVAASVKLLPVILFIPLFLRLILESETAKKITTSLALFTLGFCIPHILSFAFAPHLYRYYWLQVLGKLDGQHSPVSEINSGDGSTLYKSVSTLAHYAGFQMSVFLFLFIWVVACGVSALLVYKKIKTKLPTSHIRKDQLMWLGFLWIVLFFPRLKVYHFCYFTIPLFLLIKDLSWASRRWFFFIVIAIPMLGLVVLKSLPFLVIPHWSIAIVTRVQLLSAFISVVGITFLVVFRPTLFKNEESETI